MTTIVPVLGDQLSFDLASLRAVERADAVVLMMEVLGEATSVKHHGQKIAFLFSAMRHHAAALRDAGWRVDYVGLEDAGNRQSFAGEVDRAVARHRASRVVVVEAGEWRVMREQPEWGGAVPVEVLADDRFLVSRAWFADWARGRKRLLMEDFYRLMRRRTGLLMEGDEPAGGQWNLDGENRKPPLKGMVYPAPPVFAPDAVTDAVLALVGRHFGDHFGELRPFGRAVTRAQALLCLEDFVAHRLAHFGDYQDAMVAGEDGMFHSQLSALINCGLLGALEVCEAAEAAWRAGAAPLNAVEGFVRQIIGWREYVRGIHWIAGPDYEERNFLGATRDLPDFYWTGETGMRCVAEAVRATRENAHAHHIQRLMVLANFALLAGIEPKQVSAWFLIVYADAYEWVETPNVIGMGLFADGGLMASKPYAAGGAYINRMSDYCRGCAYDVKKRTGDGACPFNSLYWDFLARNREQLGRNHRLLRMYDGWDRFGADEQARIRAQAAGFLAEF
jgi:deoxyribodipyrimidine photolyase-related protein